MTTPFYKPKPEVLDLWHILKTRRNTFELWAASEGINTLQEFHKRALELESQGYFISGEMASLAVSKLSPSTTAKELSPTTITKNNSNNGEKEQTTKLSLPSQSTVVKKSSKSSSSFPQKKTSSQDLSPGVLLQEDQLQQQQQDKSISGKSIGPTGDSDTNENSNSES